MGAALVLLLVGLGAMAAGVLIGRYYVPDDRQLRRTARHSKAYMRALSHLVARDHETVISELRSVVEENIEDAEPYFALGAIFRSRGEHERAIRVHQALAVRERDKRKLRQRAMYELGLDFRAAGMPRRATRAMEEVVIQEPGHEGALRVLAALYEEQARFNEAAGLWQRLGRRRGEDTSHREHHLLVAAAQTALGRNDLDSAKQLLKAAQKHEESAHFFAAAAELAAARGNHRGAKERLKQALIAEPALAPHLLPGLIAAEQGLPPHPGDAGDRSSADDLDDEVAAEAARLAASSRLALPEATGGDHRRASRATQIGVVAARAPTGGGTPPTGRPITAGAGAGAGAGAAAGAAEADARATDRPRGSPSTEDLASAAVRAVSTASPAIAQRSSRNPTTEERAALGPAPSLDDDVGDTRADDPTAGVRQAIEEGSPGTADDRRRPTSDARAMKVGDVPGVADVAAARASSDIAAAEAPADIAAGRASSDIAAAEAPADIAAAGASADIAAGRASSDVAAGRASSDIAAARAPSDIAAAGASSDIAAGWASSEGALVRAAGRAALEVPTPARPPTLPGIALVPAQRPSASVTDRVLQVLTEIEAQSGPRLEIALIRAQLVPPQDTTERAALARELTARFPDALAARVATARLAMSSADPAAIRAALDALVSEDGALAWALRGRWQCAHCGHRPGPFSWRCGQCRRWGTLRMETGIEPPPVPPRERRAAPRVARPEALLGASPDESLPTATLDPGLSDSELANAATRRSLLGRVGGWVSRAWRRGA